MSQKLEHGHTWGRWYLDLETAKPKGFICYQRRDSPSISDYYIASDRLDELDWIQHIEEKRWGTPEVIDGLCTAMIEVGAAIERGEIRG